VSPARPGPFITLHLAFLGFVIASQFFVREAASHRFDVLLIFAVLLCLLVWFAFLFLIQPAIIRARLADGRCPECGYDITDADERCPECGRPNGLPPLDPRVFRSVADAERILGVDLSSRATQAGSG